MRAILAAGAAALTLTACVSTGQDPANLPAPAAESAQPPANPVESLRAYYASISDGDLPTAPAGAPQLDDDAVLTRIAIGSCSEETAPITILNQVIADQPDLFLYIGDNVYGDAYSGDMRLSELRQAYADMAENPDFQALWSTVPTLAVWDDHDFGLNDAGGDFSGKEFAERLFERFWRIDPNDESAQRPGVHAAYSYEPDGQRVQIIMLDTRFFPRSAKAH